MAGLSRPCQCIVARQKDTCTPPAHLQPPQPMQDINLRWLSTYCKAHAQRDTQPMARVVVPAAVPQPPVFGAAQACLGGVLLAYLQHGAHLRPPPPPLLMEGAFALGHRPLAGGGYPPPPSNASRGGGGGYALFAATVAAEFATAQRHERLPSRIPWPCLGLYLRRPPSGDRPVPPPPAAPKPSRRAGSCGALPPVRLSGGLPLWH